MRNDWCWGCHRSHRELIAWNSAVAENISDALLSRNSTLPFHQRPFELSLLWEESQQPFPGWQPVDLQSDCGPRHRASGQPQLSWRQLASYCDVGRVTPWLQLQHVQSIVGTFRADNSVHLSRDRKTNVLNHTISCMKYRNDKL